MSDRNYGAIRDVESLEKFVNRCIQTGEPIAFDIEAGYTGADRAKGALQQYYPDWLFVGFSFTVSENWARYVPVAHDAGGNIDDEIQCARLVWRMLMTGKIVPHNASYELTGTSIWLRKMLWNDPLVGKEIRETKAAFPIYDDTMISVWLSAEYDPLLVGKDLKNIADAAFGLKMTHFEDLFPEEETDMGPATKKAKMRYARFNTRSAYSQRVVDYGCEDSVAALMVHHKHYARPYGSTQKPLCETLIFKTEIALLQVTHEMERGPCDEATGQALGNMLLDWDLIHAKALEVKTFHTKMNEEILRNLGDRIGKEVVNLNLNSVPQLRKVFYDSPEEGGLGLPIDDRFRSDKTNEPGTSDDALRVVAKTDPLIRKILDYRQVGKLYSSYLHKFEVDIDYSGTGIVFPNHNTAGALTGRMSVDHVSYQQWPKPYKYELEDGTTFILNFRDILISPKGFRQVGFDYSQIELRVLAGQAEETAMLYAFEHDIDIHRATASTMLRIPLEDITKKERGVGKTCNFAVVYGSGAGNIADMLTAQGSPTTEDEAERLLELYYEGFSKLRAWMDRKILDGHEAGYVETMFGRKFTVWEFKDHRNWIIKKGDRMCVNAPVQGGAADYLKIGMVRVWRALKKAGLDHLVRLVMTVHDALEFYVHESVSTQTVIDIVNPAVTPRVAGLPEIRADWHECVRWGEPVEIKLDANRQITSYAIEDEDERFDTVETAYAFYDEKRKAKDAPAKPTSSPTPKITVTLPDRSKPVDGSEMRERLAKDTRNALRRKKGIPLLEDYPLSGDGQYFENEDEPHPFWEGEEGEEGFCHCGEHEEHVIHSRMAVEDLLGRKKGDIPPWAAAPKQHEDRTAVITLTEMPDENRWDNFMQWADEHPGQMPVRLETPEGPITLDQMCQVAPDDQGVLSLMLGGAGLEFLRENVDIDVTEGVTL